MSTFYNYIENGIERSFDDVFVPADSFREGNLWGWGRGGGGELGNNRGIGSVPTPVTTFAGGNNWKQVSYGNDSVGAVKTDGTLWTWGQQDEFAGTLGINATSLRSSPVTTFAGGNNWKQVSFGNRVSAAIKSDGTLWIWGNNSYGSLGINNTIHKSTPVTTFAGGNNWKQVFCGNRTIAAIKTDGTLWVWGNNSGGGLGTNDTIRRSTPVTTFAGGNNWKQVSCGYGIAAIKTDGTLWLWGRNDAGGLGTNDTIDRSTPVTTFAGGNNWKQVSISADTSPSIAAVKTDGTLWSWGDNFRGGLGTNDTIRKSTPVTTFAGGNNWKEVSYNSNDTASALKTDGTLWVWGNNFLNELGIIDTIDRSTPVTTFAGGNNWKQVSGLFAVQYIDSSI